MKWFEGSITDAVASAKARSAVFVVFVEGPPDDVVSKSVSTAINSAEVSSKLESSDFVCIKIDSGSQTYIQFAQIYQVVPVPSLFFIGRDGRPLEIVAGATSALEIMKRIEIVLAKTQEAVGSGAAQASTSHVSTPSNTNKETTQPSENAANQPSTSVPPEKKETESEAKDKLEAAKALVEKARLKKLEEEKAREKEREMERRKVGQEVQRLKQWQQDQEYKQLKEDREREKREELAARERVRKQIAQDKAERAKRNNQAQVMQAAEKEAQNIPIVVSSNNTARLQLRLPDGSAITHQMPSSAHLGELRAFVANRLCQPSSNFSMSTTFPRRILTSAEDSQTMIQLELVPTAVILILPAGSGGIVRAGASTSSAITPVTQMFWALLSPLLSIFTYVKNLVFGRGSNTTGTGGVSSDASSRRRLSPEPSAQGGATRRIPATSEVRRQGNSNIHRLAQARDSSDEDNNTWNGNSTQQM